MRTLKKSALAATAAAFMGLPAAAQTEPCVADWSAATAIVKAEGLVTIDQLTKLAQVKLGGEIVRSTLCGTKPKYVYKLVIRDASGQIKTVIVDARKPFDP